MDIAVIGHRGASGFYPENTLLSFQKAFEMGCNGIELDIQTSADDEILVFHDWTLDRTSNGTGLLREQSFDYLRGLDAGSWYDEKREDCKNLQIPTLEEVLDIVPKNKLVNIEIKELFSEKRLNIEKLLSITRNFGDITILVSSFSHNIISDVYKADRTTKIGLLLDATFCDLPAYITQLDFDIYSYHPYISLLSETEIKWMHAHNIKVYPWTVEEAYEREICKKLDVDGIITNYPKILIKENYKNI